MTDLQDIGAQLFPMVLEQPILFCPLGVSNKQKAHQPETRDGDSAREIRILEPDRPRGIGRKKREAYAIYQKGIARMHPVPFDTLFPCGREREAVSIGSTRERRVPVCVRT